MKTEENIVTFINNLEAENQDIECKQCKRILLILTKMVKINIQQKN